MALLAGRTDTRSLIEPNNKCQFHCGRCSMKTVPSKSMCSNAPAAMAGYGFSPRFIPLMPPGKFWTGSVCLPARHLWRPPPQTRSHSNGPEDRGEPLQKPGSDSCAFIPLAVGIRLPDWTEFCHLAAVDADIRPYCPIPGPVKNPQNHVRSCTARSFFRLFFLCAVSARPIVRMASSHKNHLTRCSRRAALLIFID